MKNRKTRSAMRRMLFTLALVLVVAVASVGGTIAWLTASTAPVTNTFTVGDINIELKETLKPDGTEVTAGVTDWSAKLIPGSEYAKDPTVTVKGGSEACWLFVKVEEPASLSGILSYTLNTTGWTKGEGTGDGKNGVPENVYYRFVDATDSDVSFTLLTGNKVTVSPNVTKAQIDEWSKTNTSATMTFTAYAIQKEHTGTVGEAWTKLNATTTPTT